jgi:predicted transposase YbfD/YdcC
MSGADGWESIERCGVMRGKWLCKFLALEEGIPKHDVYRRVLGAIQSELLETCFMNWVRDIKQDIRREVIAIDGKTMRGMATNSRFKVGTEASIHISVRAKENQLVFAQVQTEAKSSEITAIPALLEQIAIDAADIAWMWREEGESIAIPAKEDETARDLLRCRGDLKENLKSMKQRLLKFLLRKGKNCESERYWMSSTEIG